MTRNDPPNKKESRAHLASLCFERNLDRLKILLERKDYRLLIAGDDDCLSLLQMAIRLCFPDVVETLLRYYKPTDKDAAFCLKDALYTGDGTIVRLVAESLVKRGIKILSVSENVVGPILLYALENYPEMAVEMLHVAQNRQPNTLPEALNTPWKGTSPIRIANVPPCVMENPVDRN